MSKTEIANIVLEDPYRAIELISNLQEQNEAAINAIEELEDRLLNRMGLKCS